MKNTIRTTPLHMYQKDTYDECIGENPCIICGKDTGLNPKYWVHLLTNGDLISSDEDFDNSQGFFPIGIECKKKLRGQFVFKS